MIELERTFLAKTLPSNLKNCKFKEIIDVYIPKSSKHCPIRLRKNGDKFELTKKTPMDGEFNKLLEQTIILTKEEFDDFNTQLDGKRIHKIRYYYNHQGRMAEIDVFQDDLKGLVLIDFEFETQEEMEQFTIPDFCLIDITPEEFIAGGMICGKKYSDIEHDLNRFNYKKVFLE